MTTCPVEIDEVDQQILRMLLKDARLTLKEISKECGLSSVSVLKRINRLKKQGVITGATLFASLEVYHFQIIAFVGIDTESNSCVNEILSYLREHTFLVEPSISIGKYDLHALIYAKDLNDLNNRIGLIKRQKGVRNIVVSVWSGAPRGSYENLDLTPKKAEHNG